MKQRSKDLLTSVTQMWVAFGACRDEKRAEEIKLDADKSTKALIAYIEELEAGR